MPEPSHPALPATAAANRAVAMELPFEDQRDLELATRGRVAELPPELVTHTGGRVVWDPGAYDFLDHDCPDTVNPSLWRQARLVTTGGLFEVAPGFYQVRGLDLSNMTLVEGGRGVVVIDPLISTETAAAALALYRAHRGERPVTGLVYTHSHVDHFGGARGVLTDEEVAAGVPVIAPEGLVEHAVSENLYAGTAMARRATFMYGALLPTGPEGQVTAGLGPTTSTGTVTLIPPTLDITETGQEVTVDGVRMVFQLTPGTEAPAEMNFFFPEHRLLCAAENATHNLHNVLTLRGALVRDPRRWSRYLDETIELFGADLDAVFASHHWPTWGNEAALTFLREQRDLYGYLHDQTLRLLNDGLTGPEIAEQLELPPSLARSWHCRGYYGSLSHNAKAVYQRYMGWYDGNPAHLWPHPPEAAATRYVEYMGGADAVVERARGSYAAGDLRWVAEVLNHVVFARPDHTEARELLADAYRQLAYGAENATWRNAYLVAATELAQGPEGAATTTAARDLLSQLSVDQVFASMATRLDGPRAWDEHLLVNWTFTDLDEHHLLHLENGVLGHRPGRHHPEAHASLTTTRADLVRMLVRELPIVEALEDGRLVIEGDADALARLMGLLSRPDPHFAIVEP